MINPILDSLAPFHTILKEHPLYNNLNSKENVIRFMEIHVYSVWDFMNLLKYLQYDLTCTTIPWTPKNSAKLSRLINEIVLEEESDIIDEKETSHFIYYLNAIKHLQPNIDHISKFRDSMQTNLSYIDLITQTFIPKPAQSFMKTTYSFTQSSLLEVASAFTFGREALVPTLFEPIKAHLTHSNDQHIQAFISYLERHIQLDGEQHSKLAYSMIETLAKSDKDWQIVESAAKIALKARIQLWDNIVNIIKT